MPAVVAGNQAGPAVENWLVNQYVCWPGYSVIELDTVEKPLISIAAQFRSDEFPMYQFANASAPF